jgi:hypothetical protein
MTTEQCANCGTSLIAKYCHVCGQHRVRPDELSVAHFVTQFGNELAHLDFKTLRSLVSLLRPGFLTGQFLAGRRRPYTSPLKLYLICAAIFFVCAPYANLTLDALLDQDASTRFRTIVEQQVAEKGLTWELFRERFDVRFQTVYTLSLGVSVLAAALLLALLYRHRRMTLAAHIVFAIHYVAFLYLAVIPVGVIHQALGPLGPLVSLVLTYAVLGPYLYLAMRRVYDDKPSKTVLKVVVMLAVSFIVDNLVNLGAFALTIWLV